MRKNEDLTKIRYMRFTPVEAEIVAKIADLDSRSQAQAVRMIVKRFGPQLLNEIKARLDKQDNAQN